MTLLRSNRLCSRRDIELTNWKPRFKRWILFVDPVRQNGQTLFVHFREAAFDHDCFRLAICAGENLKCSVADGGHEGGMPLLHAEIALAAGDDDHMDIFRADELCWGYEFEMQCHVRSEETTSELQSLMRISYAVFCLKKQNITQQKI